MKNRLIPLGVFFIVFLIHMIAPAPVSAVSQAECAIWLCLPGGFPAGCGAAKAAMMRRLKKRKPPLPPFGSCAVEDVYSAGMSFKRGVASYYGEERECVKEGRIAGDEYGCVEWKVIPAHYKKDIWGRPGKDGCLANHRYIEVYIDGQLAGETHYFKW